MLSYSKQSNLAINLQNQATILYFFIYLLTYTELKKL